MSIFEKIAVFLLRLVGLWGIIMGLQSIVWSILSLFGVSGKTEYGSAWAIAAGVYLVGGVLLFVFSGRLGRLVGRGLQ
jgi:hypothetical protein